METRNETDRGASYNGAVPPPVEKASIAEDYIDIFHAPSQVFARRSASGFGLHLLLVSLVSAALAFANRGYMRQVFAAEGDRTVAKMTAANPQMTAEMAERTRSMSEASGMFFGYIGTPIMLLVMALFVWALARWVAGARISYGQSALITTLAWIPRLVGTFLTTIQVALMDTSGESSMFGLSASPARFMDPETTNPKLYGIAGSFDVFAIWFTILIGIGIAVIGRVPRSKGYIAAGAFFVLGLIPMLFR